MSNVLRDSSETRFMSLFDDNSSIYLIPNYQRPYAWDEKQIEDFLLDIEDAFLKYLEAYLFGNIYLAKVEKCKDLRDFLSDKILKKYLIDYCQNENIKILSENLSKINTYLIIDGQQRLTTFSIFLKVLGLDNLKIKLRNGNSIPKLILGEIDNEFYQKLIVNDEIIDKKDTRSLSHDRLKKAVNKIKKFLKERNYINNDDFKILVKNNLNIIRSEISDMKYAVILFISQTDRGKELNYIERLKSLLQFYIYIKLPHMEDDFAKNIDKTFVKLLNIMDFSIKNKIFDNEDHFEDYFFKILSMLLFMKDHSNIRELFRYSPKKAYQYIYQELRKAYKNSTEEINELLQSIISNINKFIRLLDYINSKLDNEDFKRIFVHLRPNFKILAILTNIYDKFPDTDFTERNLTWENTCNLNQKFSNELNELEQKISKMKDIFKDLEISVKKKGYTNSLKNFLKNKINNIKKNINIFNSKKNLKISILDFVEIFELSIWKLSKEPIHLFKNNWNESFSKESKLDLQGIISSFGEFIESYRCKYLVENKNFKYIFAEYERLNNGNDDIWEIIENKKIEEEHIFPKEVNDPIANNLKKYGFNDIDEYQDFISIYGNRTFLEKRLNASIGNGTIFNKASNYKEFCEKGKTHIKDICKLGEDLKKIVQYSNRQQNPAFKYYLEIRNLEIKVFAYKRFPTI